ncbi:restriction endonuclease subunit S [Mesoplasma chauliocola]|nr:restriction endonuclease subunit S [Mesoplasma chauliocola]
MELQELFNIYYGSNLNFSDMKPVIKNPVPFVSRTVKTNGIVGFVEQIESVLPFKEFGITVPLGGEGRLTANLQFEKFYTGQNVAVLYSKIPLTLNQTFYYIQCIRMNQFKYSAFGREANATLKSIKIPNLDEIPVWVEEINFKSSDFKLNADSLNINIDDTWRKVNFLEAFEIISNKCEKISVEYAKTKLMIGDIPVVSTTTYNNGVICKNKVEKNNIFTLFPKNSFTLSKNGQPGIVFYHEYQYMITSDVIVVKPKFPIENLNSKTATFIKYQIEKSLFKFNYGRKLKESRLKEINLLLPFSNGKIDLSKIFNK